MSTPLLQLHGALCATLAAALLMLGACGRSVVAPPRDSTGLPASSPPGVTVRGEIFIKTRGGQNVKLGLVEVKAIPAAKFKPILDALSSKIQKAAQDIYNSEVLGSAQLAMFDNKIESLKLIDRQLATYERRFQAEMDAHDDATNAAFRSAAENRHQRRIKIAEYAQELTVKVKEFREEAAAIVASHRILTRRVITEEINGLIRNVITSRSNSEGKFKLSLPTSEPYVLLALDERLVGDETETYAWAVNLMPGQVEASDEIILSSHNEITTMDPANAIPAALFGESGRRELTSETEKKVNELAELPSIPEELPRLAPKGEMYLSKYTSARVSNGIIGFPPGSCVKLEAENGSMKKVVCGGVKFTVEAGALTNNLDKAEALLLDDSAQQSQIYTDNETARKLEDIKNRELLMRHARNVEDFSRAIIEGNAIGAHPTALDQ